MIRYGANVFYAKLDIESFFNHGHDLFLTDNGVVLCYEDIAPMYLTFHYRPPHEQDPGGLKHEEKQRAAGVGSSFEEETPSAAADSSEATGGSPSGEVPARRVQQKAMPKKKAKAKASTDADADRGGCPSGEVPVVDESRRYVDSFEKTNFVRQRPVALRPPRVPLGTRMRQATPSMDVWMRRVSSRRRNSGTSSRRRGTTRGNFFHHGVDPPQGSVWE